ncbi:MAG: lysophospholipase [Oscillospiraceae bacterium]|nr:lysophospholipase [Oscillospiraceae bacterium]
MQTDKISIRAKDGADITAVTRDLGEAIKGVVIISHGFGEHSGSYNELMENLAGGGYGSVILDQRGHGQLSENPKKRNKLLGIVPKYKCFLDDIDSVSDYVKQEAPGKPIALYGHSMGGNIVANYLLRLKTAKDDVSCAVLESPWFGLYKDVSPLVSGMAKVLGGISSKIAIINKLSYDDITGDKARATEIENDPLYHNRISMRLFSGIRKACKYAVKKASKLTVPTFLAYAGSDRIVSNKAIREFFGRSGPNVKIKEYDSCHAIHNDLQKGVFHQDMIDFLDRHCAVD